MSKLKFKYSLSVLNVSVIAGLLFLIVLSIVDWNILSGNGGWGIVYLIGVGLFILTGFIVDLILQLIFRNKKKLNLICVIVVLIYGFLIFKYS